MPETGIDLERELDQLYRLPLAGFVEGRDALSARLKGAKDREGAARVKALRKPSVPAWAINQLPHTAPELWNEILSFADQLRSASPGAVREILQARREALASARRKAEELLVQSGSDPAFATMQRVSATLEALANYGTSPDRPKAGRLSEEVLPLGLEELSALALLPASVPPVIPEPERPAEPGPAAREEPPRADVEKERLEAERARRVFEKAMAAANAARSRLSEATEQHQAAAAATRKAAASLSEAQRIERKAEESLEAARNAVAEAEDAVRKARPGGEK